MTEAEAARTQRYRFGPLERSGVIAGWRGGQVACVATGLVIAVVVLRADAHLGGLALACVAVAAGGFSAAWPIGGMTVEQWMPIVARWVLGGSHRSVSEVPRVGLIGSARGAQQVGRPFPGVLAGCSILAAPAPAGGTVGVVCDARRGTFLAVLAVSSQGFGLLELAERDQRVASWSALMAGLARDRCPVDRLQWVTRTLPDSGQAVRRHFESARRMESSSPAVASYGELLSGEALDTMRHECFLSVRVDARRLPGIHTRGVAPFRVPGRSGAADDVSGRSGRAGRSSAVHQAAASALVREVSSLATELASAGVTVEGVLDPDSVAHVIGEAHRAGPFSEASTFPAGGPWPMGTRCEWAHYLTDEVAHAVYWIAEWPRVEVGADFLAPLLLYGNQRVTVSVTMEPVDPLRATRKVENARVSRAADEELRHRGGFSYTARRRREDEALSTRETELADGHAHYRFSGYVGVTASGLEELTAACAAVEQAASKSFLALRRLYGDQERAFTWLLPLARGLS